MMVDVESDLVERTESFGGDAPTAVRQAICAFANDLPGHNRPGVIFVGVRDDGSHAELEINDALLHRLAQCRSDGNILPPPSMTVAKHTLGAKEVAVVTVAPADSPPVRFRGRIWIRVGPTRALATAQDERILNEKRRYGDAPFDVRPVRNATLADLDLPRFQYLYLPNAFDADVLAANDRTVEERLAATKMIASADDPVPTVLGILMLSHKPTDFLPGAYVQFLRFSGRDRHDPVEDSSRFDAAVADTVRDLDSTLRAQIHTAVEVGTGSTEIRRRYIPAPGAPGTCAQCRHAPCVRGHQQPHPRQLVHRSRRDHQPGRRLRRRIANELRRTRRCGLPQPESRGRHARDRAGATLRHWHSVSPPRVAGQQPSRTCIRGRSASHPLPGDHQT